MQVGAFSRNRIGHARHHARFPPCGASASRLSRLNHQRHHRSAASPGAREHSSPSVLGAVGRNMETPNGALSIRCGLVSSGLFPRARCGRASRDACWRPVGAVAGGGRVRLRSRHALHVSAHPGCSGGDGVPRAGVERKPRGSGSHARKRVSRMTAGGPTSRNAAWRQGCSHSLRRLCRALGLSEMLVQGSVESFAHSPRGNVRTRQSDGTGDVQSLHRGGGPRTVPFFLA